jgi:hypothetical protein
MPTASPSFRPAIGIETERAHAGDGESKRLPRLYAKTLMFNGYGDQVASLYSGMDLRKNF